MCFIDFHLEQGRNPTCSIVHIAIDIAEYHNVHALQYVDNNKNIVISLGWLLLSWWTTYMIDALHNFIS